MALTAKSLIVSLGRAQVSYCFPIFSYRKSIVLEGLRMGKLMMCDKT